MEINFNGANFNELEYTFPDNFIDSIIKQINEKEKGQEYEHKFSLKIQSREDYEEYKKIFKSCIKTNDSEEKQNEFLHDSWFGVKNTDKRVLKYRYFYRRMEMLKKDFEEWEDEY